MNTQKQTAYQRFDNLTEKWSKQIASDLIVMFEPLQLIGTQQLCLLLDIKEQTLLKLPLTKIRLGQGRKARIKFRIQEVKDLIEKNAIQSQQQTDEV